MLWKSGQDNLSIIDTEDFSRRETIKQFWTFQQRSSQPVSACADRTAEKIVAISQPNPDLCALHYYEDTKAQTLAYVKDLREVFPSRKGFWFFIREKGFFLLFFFINIFMRRFFCIKNNFKKFLNKNNSILFILKVFL